MHDRLNPSKPVIDENVVISLTASQLKAFARMIVEEYANSTDLLPRPKYLFNNKTLQAYLGVNHRLLAKYRNDGYLGYTQIGEKFFYIQEDVEKLLQSNYYKAFKYQD